ncbi:hypothetical protein JKA74_05810 [Marivirga sp. S37H4]|uniref:Lipoprotein n=1 Tax=Marivirga aurantiaca TaxID=2802615 RepID=A0A934WX65_9BACT|nr:hypothetical protein [Marivirga aurantiaca]MBK6264547.1 hypothetical protein [Marivirga aurantiaca]
MKLNYVFSLLAFFSLMISACDPKIEGRENDSGLWAYEKELMEKGNDIPVKEYNEAIEKALSIRMPWVYSPISIALRIAGQQMVSSEVNVASKSLSPTHLITHVAVMVEKKELQEGLIHDQYYRIELKLGGSIWQVTQIHNAWKCKEGKGPQALTSEPCK